MDEEEVIIEEENILSENEDGNIMELIKTESAEMNIQIYVLSVISLGPQFTFKIHTRVSSFFYFSCDGGVCCLFSLQK